MNGAASASPLVQFRQRPSPPLDFVFRMGFSVLARDACAVVGLGLASNRPTSTTFLTTARIVPCARRYAQFPGDYDGNPRGAGTLIGSAALHRTSPTRKHAKT